MTTLAQKRAQKLAEAQARIATKREQIELEKWDDNDYVDREALSELQLGTFARLKELEAEVRTLIKDANVFINGQQVEYQDLRGIRGLGAEVQALSTLVSNCVYSIDQLKDELCEHVGINQILGQKLLNALGNTSYWSNKSHEVIHETPYDLDMVEFLLPKALSQLGLDYLDCSDITEERQQARYKTDGARAQTKLNQYLKALEDFELEGQELV
jgi:hypothetical protein